MSAQGGVWLPGVSAPGGGVCLWSGGGYIPSCNVYIPSCNVNRMTDACENITLATKKLRPVKMVKSNNTKTTLAVADRRGGGGDKEAMTPAL